MKRASLCLIFLALIFSSVVVSAVNTPITVKTLPNHDILIRALKITDTANNLIESFYGDSDSFGNISVTLSSDEPNFNIRVWVKKDNVVVVYDIFENEYPAGELVSLEVYPEWYLKQKEIEKTMNKNSSSEENAADESAQVVNVSDENSTENEILNQSDKDSKIIGGVVSQDKGFFSNKMLNYILVAVFILIILFTAGFVITKKQKRSFSNPVLYKVNPNNKTDAERIMEAEKRIRDSREEIERIRNRGKTFAVF
ncbi:MAG: hypothetical protein AABX28_00600 [Nanoarchaeota archaeon]